MIDWHVVISSSLWILGLAMVLAVFSYLDFPAGGTSRRLKSSLLETGRTYWARAGAALLCAGMGLTADSLLESVLWALLCVLSIYGWWTGRRRLLNGAVGSHSAPVEVAASGPTDRSSHVNRRIPVVSAVAEWLVKAELLWLVLLAPFLLSPTPDRLPLLLAIPVIWVARRIARHHFVPRTPLDWPIATIMLMLLVSIYATPDLGFSLDKITNLILGVAVYYALIAWIRTPGRLQPALLLYVFFGAVVAFVGLLGTGWSNKLPVLGSIVAYLPPVLKGLSRAPEGFNPNITGGSLLWVVPLQIPVVWHAWTSGFVPSLHGGWRLFLRLALTLALLLSAGTLLLSQSRGALLGLALCALLLLWLFAPKLRIGLVGAAIVATGLLAYVGPETVLDKLLDAPGTQPIVSRSIASGQSRLEVWSRALNGIQDFPFTGMGLHAFREVQPVLYPFLSIDPDIDIGHAHNQFLQAALDLGIPGLVAYLAIWILACVLVVQCWRGAAEGWVRAASAGIGACLFGYFVFGLADVVVLGDKRGFVFWALLALLSALWQVQFAQQIDSKEQAVILEEAEASGGAGAVGRGGRQVETSSVR